MYAQALESEGLLVVRLGPVGPREIVAPALELDQIDLVPEYIGSAAAFWGASDTNPDPEAARADLDGLLSEHGLTTLAASPAQDQNVFVALAEAAESAEIDSLTDLAEVAGSLRFGGPPECVDRPLCLAGLEEVYGIRFAEFVSQRTLAFTAEALKRDEIDVGLLFSTSPELADPELAALDDDRGLQPAENVIPVIRSAALAHWGDEVETTLDRLSAQLTTIDLRFLNARVANGEAIGDLAAEWLAENFSSDGD